MINILTYLGMSLQSELCLWTLIGLLTTIFDATLFKVNANLIQVWQMTMPEELSMGVQRVLRTMISGVMLVQCFTVYVFLAAYIVLLYPVFLEERPTLVLPWLLLAAIKKLLCELTSLALGLGTCVLLGAARPPCIKFLVMKIFSITPSFYMWMLVLNYYNALKLASTFKFATALPTDDNDFGLELAVRRRRTKSLLGEEILRKKLVANVYSPDIQSTPVNGNISPNVGPTRMAHSTDTNIEDSVIDMNPMPSFDSARSTSSHRAVGSGIFEECCGNEVSLPRDADRILEQFVMMMMRIAVYMKKEGIPPLNLINVHVQSSLSHKQQSIGCMTVDDEPPPPSYVASSTGKSAGYIRDYPLIFNKRQQRRVDLRPSTQTQMESDNNGNMKFVHKSVSYSLDKTVSVEVEKITRRRIIDDRNKDHPKSSKADHNKYKLEKMDSEEEEEESKNMNKIYQNENSFAGTPNEEFSSLSSFDDEEKKILKQAMKKTSVKDTQTIDDTDDEDLLNNDNNNLNKTASHSRSRSKNK